MLDDHVQSFYEFWRKIRCPKCDSVNWIYDSHSQRHYADTIDGIKCHSCGFFFWAGDKDELLVRYQYISEDPIKETDIDNDFFEEHVRYVDGKPTPE